MKIRWKKIGPKTLEGWIGKVRVFEIDATGPILLICELPHATNRHYGRLITEHKTTQDAARAATATFKHWLARLRG